MKNDDKHIGFNEQVVKYLSGEMEASEKLHFEALLASDAGLEKEFREYLRIWEGAGTLAGQSDYNMDAEWGLMASKIDFGEVRTRTISFHRSFLRIAAAMLIGLTGIAGYFVIKNSQSYEQVSLEKGTEIIHLPDGSEVTLNAGSQIRYSMNASSPVRKVILVGEAFFEVARDTSCPFVIEAGSAIVEVLGTSFNVNAYENNEIIEVTVRSGLVSMTSKKDSDRQILLNPGNVGVLDSNGKNLSLLTKADPNNFAWKTRDLEFSGTPLSQVVEVISHVYQVELVLGSKDISDYTITVSFNQQELSAVLNVITNTLDLEMKREDGRIVLYGL